MKVTSVTYHRRKNLGNYEYEEISLTAEIDEDEDRDEAITELKLTAMEGLGIEFLKPSPETNFDEKSW